MPEAIGAWNAFVDRLAEKIFERRIVAADIRVTDGAHRDLRRRELAAVTVSACFVTWKTRYRGVVRAFVTGVAGDGTVALARVKELGVVELRALGGDRLEEKKY